MSKTVLITGASSGFGKDAISVFHQRGWNIIATMRTPEKGTELTKMDRILVTRLDVTDKQSIRDAVDKSIERFGTIDVLVNNAGYGAIGAPGGSIRRHYSATVRRQFFWADRRDNHHPFWITVPCNQIRPGRASRAAIGPISVAPR